MSPEKPINTPLLLRSTINCSFRVLILSILLGLMIFWGTDGFDTFNITNLHKDSTIFNLSPTKPHQDFTQNLQQLTPTNPLSLNSVSTESHSGYSSTLLSRWIAPGGSPCKDSITDNIDIHGLDNINRNIELSTGDIHEYVIQSLDSSGNPRCLGGDYFETDLSSATWKSRPPVKDFGNGSYQITLQVHPDFAGDFNLTVILLFSNYQGLKLSPERFAIDKTLRTVPIKFKKLNSISTVGLPELKLCKRSDYVTDVWAGRWTRHAKNEKCVISNDGRYRCLNHDYPCTRPWCDGHLGVLESNGWIYSTHCSFKLYNSGLVSDSDLVWNCLNNCWLFFWGDSNHCDTIRNMLNFILGYEIGVVSRRFDMNITNPRNGSQSFRITNVFNGHYNVTGNYQGLNSLYNVGYRRFLTDYFSGERVPDTIIMNSGLHDGVYWPNLRRFIKGATDAAAFWAGVLEGVRRRNVVVPKVVYRTAVATGGYARKLVFNPSKMEAFNGVFVDKLREFGVIDYVVDHFDMTYVWHYDNRCSDGVHYGRAPAKMRWRDGEIGHQYFVDLMLCHVLLNLVCSN
ncbi:hypothetical protein HanRHA438_Chr06g0276041 [Helianthus annuus]|uniref:Uncharacterized protein n=1 Tax=Helianthus annuus TaxID=4232 RepID=A0A251UJP2_HELAN|nr:uncharacterized protein LOC110865667 [Helianthus annuus]KAF5803063.1 hypothetical protein HanXRQr2_Chr06g0266931 [Helianthus annuus]KAJ0574126.1 hypothetical protein HanHA89_Chr06g0234651 [Helianthus annuus]KAJ0738460.1 hypothetical protein HanLR1_Chr06g0218571 [Helianthus annuus]KAJ0741346.1 hypothetical protein HanOQP8_Chr06g0227061 [Helianthus annuus]KAJ0912589.1 hypothetical protein HanRHA438_Chr06g0276041 [Helianthus annuus]